MLGIVEGVGSSESPAQAVAVTTRATAAPAASLTFSAKAETIVVDDDLRPIPNGSGAVGRLATRGRVPLAYYKDPERSARTFVEIDGARWSLPGDMATIDADGTVHLLGRGSQCINTGGEKVYPEEVEAVLKTAAAVARCRRDRRPRRAIRPARRRDRRARRPPHRAGTRRAPSALSRLPRGIQDPARHARGRRGAPQRGGQGGSGLGPRRRGLRPGLVYVAFSAYGHTGPWRERRGYDSLVQTASGIAVEQGTRPQGVDAPRHLPAAALDYATGYPAAAAAILALQARHMSGADAPAYARRSPRPRVARRSRPRRRHGRDRPDCGGRDGPARGHDDQYGHVTHVRAGDLSRDAAALVRQDAGCPVTTSAADRPVAARG